MSEVVKRVTDAVHTARLNYDGVSGLDWTIALAAIEALREPTEAMVAAADNIRVLGADLHDFVAYDCAPVMWQAMIDAALGVPHGTDP